MPITATGIGSGLDVESLVSQLVLSDVQPTERRLNTSEAAYQAQVTAFGTLKNALGSFQTAVASASSSGQYLGKAATTSLFSTVTASAEADAQEGEYAIEVSALAQSQSLATTTYTSTTSTVGTGVLTISTGTVTYDSSGSAVTGFSAKSTSTPAVITIDSSNNTLSGVRDAINASDSGAIASIVNDGSGYRLVLQGRQSGAENSVTISVSDTGDGNSTDNEGLSKLAFDQTTANVVQTNAASNAALTINGLAVASSSNTVSTAVDGITFELKKVSSEPITITVAKNLTAAKASIEGLVNGFNALNAEINALTSYNSDTSQGSLLTGDVTVRNLARTLRASLNQGVVSTGGLYSTLAGLGITSNVSDGSLSIDTTKLDAILANDPSDVAKVLASFGTPTSNEVQFVGATANTTAGTYAVLGSTTTTSGSFTASNPITVTSFNGSGNNAVFSISVDGATAVEVTLSNNDSTTTEVLGRINTALASAGVTASLNSNVLTFTSDSAGTSSTVAITAADTNAVSGLGLAVATGSPGTSTIDYTINGSAVTRQEDVITGAVGTAVEGLSLRVPGNATGDLGTVAVTLGIANPLDKLITDLLADDGLIDAKLDGLNSSITDITEQRSALELRAAALEKRYRNQFNGLETLISQLNTTQSFLTTALSQFVDPLSFKK